MLGASINVVPFMIHRSVPGIGPYVLPAFLFAMLPALLAAFAYGSLASAMPRAGGSYIYASRGLSPYLGFIASFSQWFGLSIVIGVIAYVIIPFIRDVFIGLNWLNLAALVEDGIIRIGLALCLIWLFVYVNIRGGKFYERTLIPLMMLMFALGGIVIVAGYSFDHNDFAKAANLNVAMLSANPEQVWHWPSFFSAAAVLFASFIGFDSIAQAGGEAKNPTRNLPLAILLTIVIVGGFYFLFTSAVYHAVPWTYVAEMTKTQDITAPGLISPLLPASLSVAIILGAAIALINDLPAMLLSVSRLVFAWADDGVFPGAIAVTHKKHHTPHRALYLSGFIASIGVLGSHFAGDFFLGIDIMVTSMLVNFLLMCLTLIAIHRINPGLAEKISILPNRIMQVIIGIAGAMLLLVFLIVHTLKDLQAEVSAWYFHSTPIWLIVMGLGSVIFLIKMQHLKQSGLDTKELFENLPQE